MSSRHIGAALVMLVLVLAFAALAPAVEPHAGMLRGPDVSATHIVFRYANDLWLVPREGGVATPLASPPGAENFPRFSPDGQVIAFLGNYDGNRDIYTIPVTGGTPFRVTHHPSGEFVWDWTPDGRIMFSAWGMGDNPNAIELRSVSASGGLSELLPGAVRHERVRERRRPVARLRSQLAHRLVHVEALPWRSGSGRLALRPRGPRRRRRSRTGRATTTIRCGRGRQVFYVSDAGPEHRFNVWVYDTATGERRQVTTYADHDLKSPSIGPGDHGQGEIVYQHGPELCAARPGHGSRRASCR